MNNLDEKFDCACWVAHKLFDRQMGPGTTGNLSFRHDGKIYITASGTCFGKLTISDFSVYDMEKKETSGPKPSKELPLHCIAYEADSEVNAVIHVHSEYAVLWSCLNNENEKDCIPDYTPYLKMKVGRVGLVPYANPGSEELFENFKKNVTNSDAWILKNHGPVVGAKSIMDAFAGLEELEYACKIAWELRNLNIPQIEVK